MVSSVRRFTEYMSPLYGLKVSVITSCQALKDIHLTLVTWLHIDLSKGKCAEHMSMAVHGTSHGAYDFCTQQPKTCMVALPFYVL